MMPSPMLLEDSTTQVKLLSVLGNPPSMQFSKSSFSIATRCRKCRLMHGGLQATAVSAVFTLFNFFFSLSLFFISSFPSLSSRKKKMVLLLGISHEKRQSMCPDNGHRIAPCVLSPSHQSPSLCFPKGQAKVVKSWWKNGGDNILGENLHQQ